MALPILKVSLLTGGGDLHYAIPLAASLADQSVQLEVIAGDQFVASRDLRGSRITFLNLHGDAEPNKPFHRKISRVVSMYLRLSMYAARTDSTLFHILWHNKFPLFDRTVLIAYYKALGKKLIVTAHNVDSEERDGRSDLLGRASLRLFYRMADHIFVHTNRMKEQLEQQFNVDGKKITVIPFGMNTVVPKSGLTRAEAKRTLQIHETEKLVLFFGNIARYKGLEYLIRALAVLKQEGSSALTLVIAGNIKGRRSRPYWKEITGLIDQYKLHDWVRTEIRFIPDQDVELFFKAADVCVLPYVNIYQTGVLFLSYRFGLPVIATDVGSVKEDVIEGQTGFVCGPSDPAALARALEAYFRSELFADPDGTRRDIANWAESKYSWKGITTTISEVYRRLQLRNQRGSEKTESWAASPD